MPSTRLNPDRITAIVLLILGLGMLVGGLTMDRLEIRQIHPASIPGLVPMILGACLAFCAVLLFFSSPGSTADLPPEAPLPADTASSEHDPESAARSPRASSEHGETLSADERPSVLRLMLAGGWSIFYALALVGQLPFAWASGLYIGGFMLLFSLHNTTTLSERVMLTLRSVVFGGLMAMGIAALFEYAFLVRLP